MKCYPVCHKDQFWGPLPFIVFIIDSCDVVKYLNYMLFANDAKIYQEIKSPFGSWLLQPNISNVRLWCISICVKLNVNKTRVISFCRKTNWHGFDCKLCESSITCTDCIRDLGVLMDTKLHFHQQVDNIFSQAIRLLGLIQTVTFSFLSLHNLLMLYCSLVRPKLEYVSVAWNSVTSSDDCKLQCIEQNFLSLCHHHFFQSLRLQQW